MDRSLRDDLLDAAAELIAQRGYKGVRMQDIADANGVSRQTVYNEFGYRMSLTQALMLRDHERYLDGVDDALSSHDDLHEAVAAAVSFSLRTAADDPLKKAILTGAGSEDLLPLFEDGGNRGYLDPSWYLIAVEAGFEIWQGGEGLAVQHFSVALGNS